MAKKRDYKQEYQNYHARPEQKKNRAMRNAARRDAEAAGQVSKGDGKDVHHVHPLSKGGSNAPGNRAVVSQKRNRSYARNSRGGIK